MLWRAFLDARRGLFLLWKAFLDARQRGSKSRCGRDGTRSSPGTEDLFVIYERLAVRDATFCKAPEEMSAGMGAGDLVCAEINH